MTIDIIAPLPEHLYAEVQHFDSVKIKQLYKTYLNGIASKNSKYATVVTLWDRDNSALVAIGTSTCGPKDLPRRKLGFAIAWNRAIKQFNTEPFNFCEPFVYNPQP